jgi:hypothetical protein
MVHASGPLRIIVTGLIAQHPSLGGMTWHYLQYLLGLARLGHDVFYFEDSGLVPYDISGGVSGVDAMVFDCADNARGLATILERFGMDQRWAYRCAPESRWHGMSAEQREDVLHSADLLINVSGTLEHPQNYRSVKRLVYIDTDPVVTQIKYLKGAPEFASRVDCHDIHFSFGEHFSPVVPETGHDWLPTRQPIVLSEWVSAEPERDVFTTVMSWTSYAPLRFAGREFSQKDTEFQRFIELPRLVAPARMEVALARTEHKNWQSKLRRLPTDIRERLKKRRHLGPRELLEAAGWRVVDANERCGDFDAYREYIRSSRAEWSVAKNVYVQGRAGWFSERSACYLASGRPVILQDTGFGAVLPVGEGLLSFGTPAEAAAAVRDVDSHYDRHSLAAREIASSFFGSDEVLTDLLERAVEC